MYRYCKYYILKIQNTFIIKRACSHEPGWPFRSLCRAKLLFVSHETGYPGKRYRNFGAIFGGNAIFVLILIGIWRERDILFKFLLTETVSEVF
jgi:hypothetical protein